MNADTWDQGALMERVADDARDRWMDAYRDAIQEVIAFVHSTDLGVDEDQRHRVARGIEREFGDASDA